MPKRARPVSISSRRTKPKTKHESKAYIRSAIQEIKVTDLNDNLGATTSLSMKNLTTNLIRGTAGLNNFIGNTITPKSLSIRWSISGCITNAFLPADAWNVTRLIVFQWASETAPVGAEILQYDASGYAPFSSLGLNSRGKLRMLADLQKATFLQTADTGNNMTSNIFTGKINIPGSKLLPIEFNQGTNTVIRNNVYLAGCSDSSISPSPLIVFSSRLTFYD